MLETCEGEYDTSTDRVVCDMWMASVASSADVMLILLRESPQAETLSGLSLKHRGSMAGPGTSTRPPSDGPRFPLKQWDSKLK
jgi:hypothetical protein